MDIRYSGIKRIAAGLVTAFILCFHVIGQSASQNVAATVPLEISITPEAVGVGDQVLVSFELPFQLQDSSLIEEILPENLPGLYLVKGPYRNYLYDQNDDGTYFIRTRVRYYYASRNTGLREIPTYIVPDPDGTVHQSRPDLVRIGEYSRRVLKFPLEVTWVHRKDSVYVGETLPLILRVENQMEISLIEDVEVTAPRGVFFEKADGMEDIRRFSVAGRTLYHLPAAVYMFIAPSPGRYFIPKAKVEAGGVEGTSRTIAIDVQPLPSQVSKTGAVGIFTRTARFSNSELYVDHEAAVEITVSGTGNLPFLTLPEPEMEGVAFTEAKERLDVTADSRGYEGRRTFKYTFTPESEGSVNVHIPEFTFFSERNREVVVLKDISLQAAVNAAPVSDGPQSPAALDTLEPLPDETVRKYQHWNIFLLPSTYLAFIPLPVGFLILLFMRKKSVLLSLFSLVMFLSAGEVFSPGLGEAYQMWEQEKYTESGKLFASALDEFPDNGALYYNMALCKIKNEQFADALFLARKAKHLYPSGPMISRLPGLIEDRLKLAHQMEVPDYLHPDYSFLGLIIGVNTLAVIGILLLFRKNIVLIIAAVLFGALILITAAVETHGLIQMDKNLGTVNITVPLKRIPKDSADDWLVMEAGTAVRILEDADGFFFIENGVGTRGWIKSTAVYSHRDDNSWGSDGFWENS